MGAVLYLLSTIKQQLLEASGEQRSWCSRSGGLEEAAVANGFPEEIFSCIYCGGLLCPKVFTSTICFLQSPSSLLTSLTQLWQKQSDSGTAQCFHL
ncbi:unnamed protein product [Boreogadus saida]